jgi:hypothetical protein
MCGMTAATCMRSCASWRAAHAGSMLRSALLAFLIEVRIATTHLRIGIEEASRQSD